MESFLYQVIAAKFPDALSKLRDEAIKKRPDALKGIRRRSSFDLSQVITKHIRAESCCNDIGNAG